MNPGSEPAVAPATPRRALFDVALYVGSAVFAWLTLMFSDLPLQRAWGRVAVWSYLVGAVLALFLTGEARRRRLRLILAIAVMAGATVVPLAAAASERDEGDLGAAAQSEVFIVEEGASALLDGRNPYATRFDTGPLASRPLPTRTHVPYPPAMLAFGLPAAIAGPGPATDARIWFLVVSVVVAIAALRSMRTDEEGRLRSFQVLFVLPTGSLLLATGGHDVPVLTVLLASFVLADRGRADASGLVSGLALAMRQTSLLVIPFAMEIVPPGRRARFLGWASLPALVLVGPFLLWNPSTFVEDVVLFPLGLGENRSSARTPTLGSVLLDLMPGARTPITVLLVLAIAGSLLLLLRMRLPTTAAGASARAGLAFGVAIALAPSARFGYVVYPVSLAVWAYAFRLGAPRPEREITRGGAPSDPSRTP
jgi:hypothetical protein